MFDSLRRKIAEAIMPKQQAISRSDCAKALRVAEKALSDAEDNGESPKRLQERREICRLLRKAASEEWRPE